MFFGIKLYSFSGLFVSYFTISSAEKIDISINFLSDIETGKKWASPNTMVKLADAFSIEVYELLRPTDFLPDNTTKLIYKYTDDIFEAINKVRDDCLDRLNGPMH
jgi:transcriptional regulator with XRE-family HTH domain